MSDFHVAEHGSIVLLTPLTDAAREWISDNIPKDAMYLGHALVIEPRYADDIVNGVLADGLTISA